MNEFKGKSWSLMLPENWKGQHDEECETMYDPSGVGALQISSARKDGEVTDEDLLSFAEEHIEAGAKTKDVRLDDFSGITFSYAFDNQFWRQWFMKSNSLALFITYNCELAHKDIEYEIVDQIINSLKVINNKTT
jgi:hypothetical protein